MKKFYFILAALLMSLFFTACYSWYDEKIPMDTKTPKINLGDLLYKKIIKKRRHMTSLQFFVHPQGFEPWTH